MKRSDGDRILAKPVSQRDPNGECVAGEDRAIYRYPIEPGFDETCGEYACTLRME